MKGTAGFAADGATAPGGRGAPAGGGGRFPSLAGGAGKPGGREIAGPGCAPRSTGRGTSGGNGVEESGCAGILAAATRTKVELCGKTIVSLPESSSTMLIGSGGSVFCVLSTRRRWPWRVKTNSTGGRVPRVSVALTVPSNFPFGSAACICTARQSSHAAVEHVRRRAVEAIPLNISRLRLGYVQVPSLRHEVFGKGRDGRSARANAADGD